MAKLNLNTLNALSKYQGEAYALLRIVAGFMFAFHGLQVLFGTHSPMPRAEFGTQFWFGGVIELVGGILVMLGFVTRWAALICSGTMAVAYFQFHWRFAFNERFFPVLNQGELSVLYCFIFLYVATMGPGKWSLERRSSSGISGF